MTASFARRVSNARFAVPLLLFLVVSAVMTGINMNHISYRMGDTAVYLQAVENIAERGKPVSELESSLLAFLNVGYSKMDADRLRTDPLALPEPAEYNELYGHEYLVLFPLGFITKFVPAQLVITAAKVVCFTGFAWLAYIFLRRRAVPVVPASLFVLLVVSLPVWVDGLFYGQFYPDRAFMVTGLWMMMVVSSERPNRVLLICSALACALVHERAATVAGMFLLSYLVLFRATIRYDKRLVAGIGVALVTYGYIAVTFLVDRTYYSSFFGKSLSVALQRYEQPWFLQAVALFVLVNAVFLILACFDRRAAAIAVFLMLPNIFGTIGGAEKTGWTTHYHAYYIPALVWAAACGFAQAWRLAKSPARRAAFFAAAGIFFVALNTIDPTQQMPVFRLALLQNTFPLRIFRDAENWLGPAGIAYREQFDAFARAVPEHAIVAVQEQEMAPLYRNRTLEFYPIGLDRADYAVLSLLPTPPGYGGIVSSLGPAEQQKIDAAMFERMRVHGYDLEHPQIFRALGVAVFARTDPRP